MLRDYRIHLNSFHDCVEYWKLVRKFVFAGSVWSPDFSAGAHEMIRIFLHAPVTLELLPGMIAEGRGMRLTCVSGNPDCLKQRYRPGDIAQAGILRYDVCPADFRERKCC